MERYVTLIRVSSKDPERYQGDDDPATQIMRVVKSFGGTTEGIWAFSGGPYRFATVATYPDRISARKARTRIEALGISTIEGYPIVDMSECLQAMAS